MSCSGKLIVIEDLRERTTPNPRNAAGHFTPFFCFYFLPSQHATANRVLKEKHHTRRRPLLRHASFPESKLNVLKRPPLALFSTILLLSRLFIKHDQDSTASSAPRL